MWRRSDKQAIRRCGEMIRQGGLRQQAPPTPHTHFYLSLPLPSYLSDVPWLLSLPPPLLPERGAVALIPPSELGPDGELHPQHRAGDGVQLSLQGKCGERLHT